MKIKTPFLFLRTDAVLAAFLILITLFSTFLMTTLVSFNPFDPSWSQTSFDEPIHNLGGVVGSYLSDALFFIFGLVAYTIPPFVLSFFWNIIRQYSIQKYIDYFSISLHLIGMLVLIVTTCGLVELNIDDIWYFPSGGIIGSLIIDAITSHLSIINGELILLLFWISGLMLYTNWSWIVVEKIGKLVMTILTFSINRLLCNILQNLKKWMLTLINDYISKRKKEEDSILDSCAIPKDFPQIKINTTNNMLSTSVISEDTEISYFFVQKKFQTSISQSSCNSLSKKELDEYINRIGNISCFKDNLYSDSN